MFSTPPTRFRDDVARYGASPMSAAVSPEPHSSELLTATQRRVVIAGMMGGVSLAAIDQMVLSTAVAAIAGELGDIGQAPWVFSANLLTSASSMPIWGKLGDLYGRRRVFQFAILVFITASLVAAEAVELEQVGREQLLLERDLCVLVLRGALVQSALAEGVPVALFVRHSQPHVA